MYIINVTFDSTVITTILNVVSLSKKLYFYCLVLVGSRNGFERDLHNQKIACFTIELK